MLACHHAGLWGAFGAATFLPSRALGTGGNAFVQPGGKLACRHASLQDKWCSVCLNSGPPLTAGTGGNVPVSPGDCWHVDMPTCGDG